MGIGMQSFNSQNDGWLKEISELQSFVNEKHIALFVTTVKISGNMNTTGLLVVQDSNTAQIIPQIHNKFDWVGTGSTPYYIDLPHARVGIVTGTDFNFPETTTSLAKNGADVILISSDLGDENNINIDNSSRTMEQLKSLMLTRSNHCVHLLMSDHLGMAIGLRSEWGAVAELCVTEFDKDAIEMNLDASDTRTKYLNRYQPFDLVTLIGQ